MKRAWVWRSSGLTVALLWMTATGAGFARSAGEDTAGSSLTQTTRSQTGAAHAGAAPAGPAQAGAAQAGTAQAGAAQADAAKTAQRDATKTAPPEVAKTAQPEAAKGSAPDGHPGNRRPRIGLVLSGGGALGVAHIGVIKALEAHHVPIDYITGTSMGALIGGLYASGMSSDELEVFVRTLDWDGLFRDNPNRLNMAWRRKQDDRETASALTIGVHRGKVALPSGLMQGQRENILFKNLTSGVSRIRDFDLLPIPFHCVATDLDTGEEVVLRNGDLATALRASMSVPAVFAPVELEGRRLVDGGIVNNMPVEEARRMGADIIIASHVSNIPGGEPGANLLSLTSRLVFTMVEKSTRNQIDAITPRDLLLEPPIPPDFDGDFKNSPVLIPLGRQVTEARADRLSQLSLNEADWRSYLEHRANPDGRAPIIAAVRVENHTSLDIRVINSFIHQKIGAPLDTVMLARDIDRLYGLGTMSQVSYRLEPAGGQAALVLEAVDKSWGPTFLTFGLELQDNLEGESAYTVRLVHRRLLLNRLGGEWHNLLSIGNSQSWMTELYQPVSLNQHFFLSAVGSVQRSILPSASHPDVPGDITSTQLSGTLSAGRNFARVAELRLGATVSNIWNTVTNSPPDAEESETVALTSSSSSRAALKPIWSRSSRLAGQSQPSRGLEAGPGESTSGIEQFRLTTASASFLFDTLDFLYFPRSGVAGKVSYEAGLTLLGATSAYQRYQGNLGGAWSFGRSTVTGYLELGKVVLAPGLLGPFDFHLGGLFRLSGYAPESLAGTGMALGRVGYRYRFAGGPRGALTMPLYAGATLEAGNVFAPDSSFAVSQLIPAGALYLAADTPIGPFYLAYGRAWNGHSSMNLFLGQIF